jgi:hypothetical protein
MEETGVLVNLALLGLVLPDFEPGPKSCHFVPLFLAKLLLHLAWQWPKTSARPVSPFGMVEKEDTVHGVVDARRGS